MKGLWIIAVVLALVGGLWFFVYRDDGERERRAAGRDLVREAIQASISGEHARACTLYHEIISSRVAIDGFETQYLEDSCKRAR